MSNYKMMYLSLVKEVADTIESLQKALENAEDIFMNEAGNDSGEEDQQS